MNFQAGALRQGWRALRLFGAGILCALGLFGCAREKPADLVIANGGEPESLDPAIVTSIADMRITKALFEGLLRLDGRTGRPSPGLAESWEVSPDRRSYVFHLRTNLTWSTGEPLTTADVVYSWFRALSPETAADYAGQLFYIVNAEDYYLGKVKDRQQVGIHALDAHTLRVELNCPLAFFLDLCCFPTLAVVPQRAIAQHGDRWLNQRPLPCSGPYELVAWRLNDKVRLQKNPRYWDAAHTRNNCVDILPVASPNTALNLYYTGALDIIWDKDLVAQELMDLLKHRPEFHNFTYLGTYFYRFNVTRKPFDDPRVRKAFALATDRQRLTRKLLAGGEKPAFHFVPDGTANYSPAQGLGFDPVRARELLAEAGFPGGKGFPRIAYTFFSAAGGAAKMQGKLGVELQQMWRDELGVQIELRQIERKVFYNAQSRLDYDISASSWVGDYNDPNTFLDLYTSNSGNNRTGWKSSRYDALLREANLTADMTARTELLRQAETLLVNVEVPIVPLYFYSGFTWFDDARIKGIYSNVLDEHPIQDIWKVRPGSGQTSASQQVPPRS